MDYKVNQNLSRNMTNNSKKSNLDINKIIMAILIIIVILFIIYIIVCYYNYNKEECYEKKNFASYVFDFTSSDICTIKYKPIVSQQPPIIKKKNTNPLNDILGRQEVYHIANQDYTFDQSKCKCESYGGRLASQSEVTNAYNKGANWCTYGWSQGQKAFYPVQKCFYNELQEESNDFLENSDKYCGKPGLNGGYFANADLKFGVNCYGVKPKGSVVKPKNPECNKSRNFCELPKNFQASNKLNTDEITSFNEDKWNMN